MTEDRGPTAVARHPSDVILAPFDESDWPLVWTWCQEYWDQVADDFSPESQEDFVEFQRSRTAANLAVLRDGVLGGVIIIEPVTPDLLCLGHCLFKKPDFWGHDVTLPAIRQAASLAFTGFSKIAMHVFEDNHAMRALLEKLGVQQEGLLRSQTTRNGEPINVAVFGWLRSEFKEE